MSALGPDLWGGEDRKVPERVQRFLLNFVSMRRAEIGYVAAVVDPCPTSFRITDLPLSTRARNCLTGPGRGLVAPGEFANITLGSLLAVRSLGVRSMLEIACAAENALETTSAVPARVADELLEAGLEPWAAEVGAYDPRFADLIPVTGHASFYEAVDALTGSPDQDPRALQALSAGLQALQAAVAKIASTRLEDQLRDFLRALSGYSGQRLAAMLGRLGWAGAPPVTLEETGAVAGVTRERIRQLQAKLVDRIELVARGPIFMPALDRALEALRTRAPLTDREAAQLLKSEGVTDGAFHPASVIAAAESLGREAGLVLQIVGSRTLVTRSGLPNAELIVSTAFRQARASGASNIAEVLGEIRARATGTTREEVTTVLQNSSVTFLEGDWFTALANNPSRERLRNVVRKMLSVAAPLELGVLREGVRREYRFRGARGIGGWPLIVPPRSVLQRFFELHSDFQVSAEGLVSSAGVLDYRTELGATETIIVDVFRTSPAGVLDRTSLWAECERRGMNPNTFSLYLTYSPVVAHLGTDLWTLRGVQVDPAAVEAVRQANAMRPRERRTLDFGWSPAGGLWMATRLAFPVSGIIHVPGAVRSYLTGRDFSATDEAGHAYGRIRFTDQGGAHGFGPFLRQRGADEGDVLLIEYDLISNRATLRLADDYVLEEMSPVT